MRRIVLLYVIEMVKRSKGTLSGRTRKLKGKSRVTVAQRVRTYNIGDKVIVNPKSHTKGMPHLRYAGRHGQIVKAQGKAYVVRVTDGGKKKDLIAGAIHLKLA